MVTVPLGGGRWHRESARETNRDAKIDLCAAWQTIDLRSEDSSMIRMLSLKVFCGRMDLFLNQLVCMASQLFENSNWVRMDLSLQAAYFAVCVDFQTRLPTMCHFSESLSFVAYQPSSKIGRFYPNVLQIQATWQVLAADCYRYTALKSRNQRFRLQKWKMWRKDRASSRSILKHVANPMHFLLGDGRRDIFHTPLSSCSRVAMSYDNNHVRFLCAHGAQYSSILCKIQDGVLQGQRQTWQAISSMNSRGVVATSTVCYRYIHAALRLGQPAPTWFMLVRQ